MLGSNPSADPGTKTGAGLPVFGAPFPVPLSPVLVLKRKIPGVWGLAPRNEETWLLCRRDTHPLRFRNTLRTVPLPTGWTESFLRAQRRHETVPERVAFTPRTSRVHAAIALYVPWSHSVSAIQVPNNPLFLKASER